MEYSKSLSMNKLDQFKYHWLHLAPEPVRLFDVIVFLMFGSLGNVLYAIISQSVER